MTSSKIILASLLYFAIITTMDAGRILFHIPTPTFSHNIVYRPIIKAMASKGHEMVVITTHPMALSNNTQNIHQIDVSDCLQYWKTNFDGAVGYSLYGMIKKYVMVMTTISDMQLGNSEVKKLIQNKSEYFDLVITESVAFHATFGWAHHFNCPYVGILSLDMFYDTMDFLGNPSHPYTVHTMLMDFQVGAEMTFFERMKSVYIAISARIFPHLYQGEINAVLRKHFGQETPPIYDLAKNMSLMIVNQHHAINPRANVPKIVNMNMLHIQKPKPLPMELQKYLDENPEGVVYFSLGSNIKSSSLPQERILTLLQAFRHVPYKVLWKWEQKQLSGKPPNVMLCQWCPQQDILAHRNIRLFITQGGMQSTEEAIYFKVPMLGLPILVDQRNNIFKMVSRGCAERLDLMTMTSHDLAQTITKMMTGKKYQECIDNLSALMEDQPEKPLDRIVWWLEYVMRHKGTPHLQVPQVPWYLYLMLDFVAAFLAALLLLYYSLKMGFKIIFKQFGKHIKHKSE